MDKRKIKEREDAKNKKKQPDSAMEYSGIKWKSPQRNKRDTMRLNPEIGQVDSKRENVKTNTMKLKAKL